MSGVLWVDVDAIEEPLHLLREVDTSSPDFKAILASMKADGFWESEPLDVSEDDSGDSPLYVLNDGRTRWTAAKVLGLRKVPVVVCPKPLDDGQRLERAVVANSARVPTRRVEYAKALAKVLELNEGTTLEDLARRVRRDVGWVRQTLKLAKLEGEAASRIDAGRVPLASARVLAKLQGAGVALDENLLERAEVESVEAFAAHARPLLRKARSRSPTSRPRVRSTIDVAAELERARRDARTPVGYLEALEWVLRISSGRGGATGAA